MAWKWINFKNMLKWPAQATLIALSVPIWDKYPTFGNTTTDRPTSPLFDNCPSTVWIVHSHWRPLDSEKVPSNTKISKRWYGFCIPNCSWWTGVCIRMQSTRHCICCHYNPIEVLHIPHSHYQYLVSVVKPALHTGNWESDITASANQLTATHKYLLATTTMSHHLCLTSSRHSNWLVELFSLLL